MHLRRSLIACAAVCCAAWLAPQPSAAPQEAYDRDAYTRDYVKFLVLQLDQWTTEFPRQFNSALMQPPVDASKLSEENKAGASELGEAIKRLAALSNAKDLTTNAEFRSQLDKTLAAAKQVNPAMASQRFPARLQN